MRERPGNVDGLPLPNVAGTIQKMVVIWISLSLKPDLDMTKFIEMRSRVAKDTIWLAEKEAMLNVQSNKNIYIYNPSESNKTYNVDIIFIWL